MSNPQVMETQAQVNPIMIIHDSQCMPRWRLGKPLFHLELLWKHPQGQFVGYFMDREAVRQLRDTLTIALESPEGRAGALPTVLDASGPPA